MKKGWPIGTPVQLTRCGKIEGVADVKIPSEESEASEQEREPSRLAIRRSPAGEEGKRQVAGISLWDG